MKKQTKIRRVRMWGVFYNNRPAQAFMNEDDAISYVDTIMTGSVRNNIFGEIRPGIFEYEEVKS